VNLDLVLRHRTGRVRQGLDEPHLGQAFDEAARGAHEMGMRTRVVIVANHFEAPDVIADIGAPHESDLDQIHQVAIQRGRIPALRGELRRHVPVRDRMVEALEESQHRHPRRCGSQARAPNGCAQSP
jgi:hypothetical protein